MGDLFVFFLSSFVILIIVLDQLIKYLVVNNMFLGESIPVIPHLLHLTYILNPGAAFGIFRKSAFLFYPYRCNFDIRYRLFLF